MFSKKRKNQIPAHVNYPMPNVFPTKIEYSIKMLIQNFHSRCTKYVKHFQPKHFIAIYRDFNIFKKFRVDMKVQIQKLIVLCQ